jgi:hypothetical protein
MRGRERRGRRRRIKKTMRNRIQRNIGGDDE